MEALVLSGVSKAFGETRALVDLDLEVRGGELLGVAGPNGAGKSTLVGILAGEQPRDGGEIVIDGAPWDPFTPEHRVAVVHQEPQGWLNLTLSDNMVVGREHTRYRVPRLSAGDLDVLAELDITRYKDWLLDDCSLAVRQRAEIARAVAQKARLFLFDEPNSALTEEESNSLFAYMHGLSDAGHLVILVSHRLAELVAHCARVVVIRDGGVTATLSGAALTEPAIARELVVGLAPGQTAERGVTPSAESGAVLRLRGWSHPDGAFRDISLEVARGEIVALVGVEGSGARELVASVAGYAPGSGEIEIAGHAGSGMSARDTAYLSADRRGMLFSNLSVGNNLVIRLGIPEIASRAGLLVLRRLSRLGRELVERFRIRANSPDQPLPSLSGGNQQKVAIAAAIARRPALLALEEPTRGVDVGSKAEIYRILRDYAAGGNGVLVYCTEVPEVFELADRLAIMDDGVISKPRRVASFPDVASLAATIATGERTTVEEEDLIESHAQVALPVGEEGEGGHQAEAGGPGEATEP